MKGKEEISALDLKIEEVLGKQEALSLYNRRLESITNELNKLHAQKDQLEFAFTNKLNAFDKLMKLPVLIRKLLATKVNSDDISSEFAAEKMKYDAVCKEIELLLYESKILEQKKVSLDNLSHQLDELLTKKEKLLESYKYPSFRKLSGLNLEIYSVTRKIKHCDALKLHRKKISRGISLVELASHELIAALNKNPDLIPTFVFSYAQRQKIKWMGRKLVEIKIDLEKFLAELNIYLPEPEYSALQFTTNHFVEYYIENIIQDIKDKMFNFQGLDQIIRSLAETLEKHGEDIQKKQNELLALNTKLLGQKQQLLIEL